MRRVWVWTVIAIAAIAYVALVLRVDRARLQLPSAADVQPQEESEPPAEASREPAVLLADETAVLHTAAQRAWSFVERSYHPRTGLVSALEHYPVTTVWDMGSAVAAHYAARELGLIGDSVYVDRLRRMLTTLARLPLFAGMALNKRYYSTSIGMAGMRDEPAPEGYGWSAIDIGRLLLWLDIVRRRDPDLAPLADAVVARLRIDRIVRDGELHGALRRPGESAWHYQEGRIGYEQYAARGFARWGAGVEPALSLTRHGAGVELSGERLLRDSRGDDCLTSEPFLLIGLETGWQPAEARLARALLRAQRARHAETGRLTAWSEDAVAVAPHHFYYSCVLADGRPFVIRRPDGGMLRNGPHTISTKAAFGWYALVPSEYTVRLVEAVSAAAGETDGWPSALFERTLEEAGGENINTAAVILEAAAYVARGRRPLSSF